MATWIVHLRLAEKIYGVLDGIQLDKTAFYLGNIAIDSGKVNGDYTVTPPKLISHWYNDDPNNVQCRYEDFFHTFLDESKDFFTTSFYLGCVAHLISDNLWMKNIVWKIKEKYKEEIERDKNYIQNVKTEWYDLDYLFVRENPRFDPLNILENVHDFENKYLPWFDEDAIQLKIDEIVAFYKTIPDDFDHEYVFLDKEGMENFVNDSVEIIEEELVRLINKNNEN